MTDALKEIISAFSQRIKSPFIGFIALAFLIVNWKPVFYLVFSGKPALIKFEYFDQNTHWMNLYILPLVLGVLSALASPYITLIGAIWAERPINERRIRSAMAANRISVLKNQSLEETNRAVASIIESGKQDAEVSKISDKKIRETIQGQIVGARNSGAAGAGLLVHDTKEFSSDKSMSMKDKIQILMEQEKLAHSRSDLSEAQKLRDQINQLLGF